MVYNRWKDFFGFLWRLLVNNVELKEVRKKSEVQENLIGGKQKQYDYFDTIRVFQTRVNWYLFIQALLTVSLLGYYIQFQLYSSLDGLHSSLDL